MEAYPKLFFRSFMMPSDGTTQTRTEILREKLAKPELLLLNYSSMNLGLEPRLVYINGSFRPI